MKNIFFAFALSLFSLFLFGCASQKKFEFADFYEENINDFRTFSLSNGIPVVLKNIPSEKNVELRLLFTGGASACPQGKSGLDLLTFDLFFSSKTVRDLVSHGQFFPVSLCANDYSSCGFSCGAVYFEKALAAFVDSILNFDFTRLDYMQAESDAVSSALDRSESINFALLDALGEKLLSGHPYYEGIYYKSRNRISEQDVKANLRSLLDAKRIKIIAAGNFSLQETGKKRNAPAKPFEENAAQVKQMLENFFGKIPAGNFYAPRIPNIYFASRGDSKIYFEFAENSFCDALCFKCPARGSANYEAFALSTLALDYILRRDVIEKEKAAEYCGVGIINGKESLALIVAEGKNEKRNIKQILSAALAAFPSKEELAPLLNTFKNIYISKLRSGAQTAYATLDQIASSIYYEGNPAAYLKRIEKIQAVTAEDVVAVFVQYFLNGESVFVEVGN